MWDGLHNISIKHTKRTLSFRRASRGVVQSGHGAQNTMPASFPKKRGGHTLRTEAGLSQIIEEAPSPCVLMTERISTLRRSAYREEEAGVSRYGEISMHQTAYRNCQPGEIITPRMSRLSLCELRKSVYLTHFRAAVEFRQCHERVDPHQDHEFRNE